MNIRAELDQLRAEMATLRAEVLALRKSKTRRQRRKRSLSPKQWEALSLWGKHGQNASAAAAEAGCSRQAMTERYAGAMKKLGAAARASAGGGNGRPSKAQALPTDERGQVRTAG